VATLVPASDNGNMPRPANRTAHQSFQGPTKYARWRALGATIATVALGGLLGAGASSAAAATVPRHPAASLHGEVNVTIWSVDSDGPDFQAILSGAIGDFGPAVTVLPNGKVDPEHTSEMELELRHGTFRLYINGIASELRSHSEHEPVYAATCSDYFRVTDRVPVVAGSGTGAYRGASGSFSLTLTGNEDQKGPPCGASGFVSQILVLTGSGVVSS
jgi:hypothetical protein